uniref:NADH-ubiquinone oxidoreductase chain 6 n=1 Tax=Acrocrypta assamensis TaxID=715818 RepID=A0A411DA20_9CUCU|nr:NADH dehydrogenase subunit 6 [Acrocrypta assamensis]
MSDMKFYLMMTLIFALLFLILKHPLTCGLMLLMQTISVTLITGLLNLNYWFSYILFLIMIGGMLILFIYMTSIASNEKFKPSMKIIMISIIYFLMNLSLMFTDSSYWNYKFMLAEMKINSMNNIMMKFMHFPHNFMLMLMIIYLLLTLIAVVNITKINQGPVKQNI